MNKTEFLRTLIMMSDCVSPTVKNISHLLLAFFLVIATLMIIPAILQTAAAYVYSIQCQRFRVLKNSVTASSQNLVTVYDRYLFLYRLLACTSSLLVILLSTTPRLYGMIRNTSNKNLVFMGFVARFIATYLIVFPFMIFVWNYQMSKRASKRHLLIHNVFKVIVWSSIPITLMGLVFSLAFVLPYIHNKISYEFYYIPDVILMNYIPTSIIFTLLLFVVGSLDRQEYGILYEPVSFLILNTFFVLSNTTIFISVLTGNKDIVVNGPFAEFHYLAYVFYHMSFSGNFVLATVHSVVSEIKAEKKKRREIFRDEPAATSQEDDSRLSRHRNDMIVNMQKQFSIAYRWQSMASDQSNLEEDEEDDDFVEMSIEQNDEMPEDAPPKPPNESKRKKTLEDVTLHYNILKSSTHLKKPTRGPK